MIKKRDTKSPASVLHRLRNACMEGQSVQSAQTLFVLERFLVRVAQSRHQDHLVVKGGILMYLMLGQWVRPTEDLDFLAIQIPGDSMGKVLTEILAIDGGDGLEFDPDGMTSEDIREESGYPCQRFTIPYRFGAKHTHFIKLDLSFGDPVTPEPQAIAVHPILEDFQGGTVLGYPVETLLAEKIETMVVRGLANTRSKDLFDLWVLSRTQTDLHLNAVGGPLVHGPIHGMPRSLRRVEVVVSLSKLRLLTSCPYSSEQASETLDLRGHLRTTGQKKSDQQLWLPIA